MVGVSGSFLGISQGAIRLQDASHFLRDVSAGAQEVQKRRLQHGHQGRHPAATASPGTGTGAPPGTFKPNEDPAHEAGESAAREAQEDAGQVPNIP